MRSLLIRLVTLLTLLTVMFAAPVAQAAPGGGDDAHHVYYTEDDDHDGTANWRDSDSEAYVAGAILFHAINFLIFFGGLFYVVRRPVGDVLRDRALSIRKGLTDSAAERARAKGRYDELLARLESVSSEVDAIRLGAEEDAQEEEARIIAAAEREAVRIAEATRRNIRDEVGRARDELRRAAIAQAVGLSESLLTREINADDQRRLSRDFIDSIDSNGVNGHG